MDRPFRRYEMLLPLLFNDGTTVPGDLVDQTLLALEERFGPVSCESQVTRGQWTHEGQSYRDSLIRVYVDVADLPEHRSYFAGLKETLKTRFQQHDIWMTTYPLDVM
jgi:hypothetical protein